MPDARRWLEDLTYEIAVWTDAGRIEEILAEGSAAARDIVLASIASPVKSASGHSGNAGSCGLVAAPRTAGTFLATACYAMTEKMIDGVPS